MSRVLTTRLSKSTPEDFKFPSQTTFPRLDEFAIRLCFASSLEIWARRIVHRFHFNSNVRRERDPLACAKQKR